MSDDVEIRIDPTPTETGARRINQAFASIETAATRHIGNANTKFSELYESLNKIGQVKGVSEKAVGSFQSISTALASLSSVKGPSASLVTNLQSLASTLSTLKVPTTAAIGRLNDFAKVVGKLANGPNGSVVGRIATLSAALSGFRGPTPRAAQNLKQFFDVINNANFSTAVARNLQALARAVQGLAPFAGIVNRAAASLKQLQNASHGASFGFAGFQTRTLSLTQALFRTHAAIQAVTAVLGVRAVYDASVAFQRMELALKATLGTTAQAGAHMKFAQDMADKYGVSLGSLGQSYAQLLAAAQGTNVTVADSQKIFDGVTQAVRVYGLSTQDADGVFRALTQIISKGTVQMEELRGQLGDRLPGAVQIFAKGLGVSTQQLMKMTQQGQVTGETLRKGLLGMADELKRRTGGALGDATNSVQASLGRLQTSFTIFSSQVMKSGFGEGLKNIFDGLGNALRDPTMIGAMKALGATFSGLVSALPALTTLLGLGLVGALLRTATGAAAANAAFALMAGNLAGARVGLTAVGTAAKGAALSIGVLNTTLGVIGVAVTVAYALKNAFDRSRAAADSMAEANKNLSETVSAQATSVEDLVQKYGQLTERQRQQEYDKLSASATQYKDSLNELSRSNWWERLNPFTKGLGDAALESANLAKHASALKSPVTASGDALQAASADIESYRAKLVNAGEKVPDFIKKLAEKNAAAIQAKMSMAGVIENMLLLAKMSPQNAKATALWKMGFREAALEIWNANSAAQDLNTTLNSLAGRRDMVLNLKLALDTGDLEKAKDLYFLLKGGAQKVDAEFQARRQAFWEKNPQAEAQYRKGGVYASRFDADLRNAVTTTVRRQSDEEDAQLKRAQDKLYPSGSGRTPKPKQDPYSIDRPREALSVLDDYMSPAQKLADKLQDLRQSIDYLKKNKPDELKRLTGQDSVDGAGNSLLSNFQMKARWDAASGVPEMEAIASADKARYDALQNINLLLETQKDLNGQNTEYQIAEAKRLQGLVDKRHELAILEADVAKARQGRLDREKKFDLDNYRELDAQALEANLAGMGLRGVGISVDGQLNGLTEANELTKSQIDLNGQILNLKKLITSQVTDEVEAQRLLIQGTEALKQIQQRATLSQYDRVYAADERFREDSTNLNGAFQTAQSQGDARGMAAAQRGMRDLRNEYARARLEATDLGQAFSSTFDEMGNELLNFVSTGKLNFSGLISHMIAEIIRLAVVKPLINGLTNMFSSMIGGPIGMAASTFSGAFGGGGAVPDAGIRLHSGGVVGIQSNRKPLRLHSGGTVPRGGRSQGDLRSWEYLTQLPKGSEVLTQYDRRHRKNMGMHDVLLKAGEEVLMPDDPRHQNNVRRYHTGGVVGGSGSEPQRDPFKMSPAHEGQQGGGVNITNSITVNVPAQASRGPQADGELAKKFAQELERQQDASLRTALAYRQRNTRSMKVG